MTELNGTTFLSGANAGNVQYGSILTGSNGNASNVSVGTGTFSFANVGNINGGAGGTTVPLAETFKLTSASSSSCRSSIQSVRRAWSPFIPTGRPWGTGTATTRGRTWSARS